MLNDITHQLPPHLQDRWHAWNTKKTTNSRKLIHYTPNHFIYEITHNITSLYSAYKYTTPTKLLTFETLPEAIDHAITYALTHAAPQEDAT